LSVASSGVILRPIVAMDLFHALISTVTPKVLRRTIFGEKI
jgi:hypothetical protein